MNIFVCIKQVPDTETQIKLGSDGESVDLSHAKWILCPYDEFAVEEAIRCKEQNPQVKITVLSAGPERVQDCLRTALAMGCDEAVRIDLPEFSDSSTCAKVLAKAIEKEGEPYLIFTGKQAIDDDAAQVSQAMAELLNYPAVTVVLKASYEENKVHVEREVEGGSTEKYTLATPCLLAPQKGMNEPRYASLPNIMRAKKKEIKTLSLADLGLENLSPKIKYTKFHLPPDRSGCKMIEGDVEAQSKELVRLLREEAKII